MSDFEQSPVPPVAELSEPGQGSGLASTASDEGERTPNEPPSEPNPSSESEREPASESAARKRGSIRPAPAGWPSSEGRLRPAPMVVVYSGDSDRPAPDWEREPYSPRAPAVRGTHADETAPFLPVRSISRKTLPSGLFDALTAESQEPPPVTSEQSAAEGVEAPGPALSELEKAAPSALALESEKSSSAPVPEQRTVVVAPPQAPDVVAEGAQVDAYAQPAKRPSRTQLGPRRSASSAPAAPTEASVNAAKALAARGMRVSGRPPPPEARIPGVPRSLVIGLWLVAAGLALFLIQRARVRNANEHVSAPVALLEPDRAPGPSPAASPTLPAPNLDPQSVPASPAVSAEPAPATVASGDRNPLAASGEKRVEVEGPPAEAERSIQGVSSSPAKSSELRTVRLDVMPPDAKVFVKGAMRKGPPFLFEVRPGSRVVVEVVRPGYVARRVVLDGSKPEFAVGLLRRAQKPRPRADTAKPGVSADSSAERPAGVQSGL